MRAPRGLLALLVVAVVVPSGCRVFKRALPEDFRRGGLELVYEIGRGTGREAGPPLAAAAAEQLVFVLRRRIESLELCRPDLTVAGRELTVRLPAECGPASRRIKDLIVVGGRLEIREVDDGETLASAVGSAPPGVTLAVDRWTDHRTGAPRQARVLEGSTEALERFRARLAPDALPPALEALVAAGERGSRLYLVRREAALTRADLHDARVLADPGSGRAGVSAEFNVRGTGLLRALTARRVGSRLAIVLDGRILAAPVVAGVISTGAVRIEVDAALEPARSAEAAHDLAVVLRTGVLPAPLTLARERAIPPSR
jgi:preprotein translocase subunit SecD